MRDERAHPKAAKQIVEELQPWIQREKEEHIRRAVTMGKRGFQRIEKLWDSNEPFDPREESLAAATLDKHDGIVRRNLGMSEDEAPVSPLNLSVLSQQTVISVEVRPDSAKPAVDCESAVLPGMKHERPCAFHR